MSKFIIIQINIIFYRSYRPSYNTREAEETFTLVDSGTQRSKRKLVSSHVFTFTIKRQNSNSTEWRCSVRNKTVTCPVVVVQRGDSYSTRNTYLHASKPSIMSTVKITNLKEVRDYIFLIIVIIIIIKVVKDLAIVL